jgi:hypothetical protein
LASVIFIDRVPKLAPSDGVGELTSDPPPPPPPSQAVSINRNKDVTVQTVNRNAFIGLTSFGLIGLGRPSIRSRKSWVAMELIMDFFLQEICEIAISTDFPRFQLIKPMANAVGRPTL